MPRSVNGKKAASIFFGRPTVKIPYGLTSTFLGMPPIFVLPSTSRAANGSWNAQVWHDLVQWSLASQLD